MGGFKPDEFEFGMRVIVKPTSRLEYVKDDDERVIRLPAVGTVVAFQHGFSVTVRFDNHRGTRSFNADALRPVDIVSELALLDKLDRPPLDARPRRGFSGLSVVDRLAVLGGTSPPVPVDETWRPIGDVDEP